MDIISYRLWVPGTVAPWMMEAAVSSLLLPFSLHPVAFSPSGGCLIHLKEEKTVQGRLCGEVKGTTYRGSLSESMFLLMTDKAPEIYHVALPVVPGGLSPLFPHICKDARSGARGSGLKGM